MLAAVETVIEADGLEKRYGELLAVGGLSFRIGRGEVVGLLGPNGAGKTTVLRMLVGILTPTDGGAFLDGIDVGADAFRAKGRCGFLSGDTALYQRLTPREVLRTFGELHGMTREGIAVKTEELSQDLRMEEFLDQRCGTLSDGQRQKANLARAFLHDPPALILDEPTSSLDVITGRFVLEAIRGAGDDGKGVLFSTHVMGEAEIVCDRVILLHRGNVLARGTVAEVCEGAGAEGLTDAFLRLVDRLEAPA